MAQLQKKAKGERPKYFADPAVDRLMSITLAVAGELAVARARLDTVERLLADGGLIDLAAIDHYAPDETVRAARDAWRETYLDVVLRAVHQDREDLDRKSGIDAYEAVIAHVNET